MTSEQSTNVQSSQNRRAPQQEYLLQGSILDESTEILIHRLKGLCDDAEAGLVTFKDHEMVYSIKNAQNTTAVSVRLRRPTDSVSAPWSMCYLGNPEIGDKSRLTMVRTCVDINCSPNAASFLQDLGFKCDYEFILQGWSFRKGRIRATVSKVLKLMNPPSIEQLSPITKSHLVELSVVAPASNEQIATEIHSFADQLKPLINLDKIDHRKLATI